MTPVPYSLTYYSFRGFCVDKTQISGRGRAYVRKAASFLEITKGSILLKLLDYFDQN